jgi:hypothetical protein
MRCLTPQVAWHNKEPVLSIDIDPTTLLTPPVSLDLTAVPAPEESVAIKSTVPPTETIINDDEKMEIDEIQPSATDAPTPTEPTSTSEEAKVPESTPSSFVSQPSDFYRFATAGADTLLLVGFYCNPLPCLFSKFIIMFC